MRQQTAGIVAGLFSCVLFFSSCFFYLDISGHMNARKKAQPLVFPADHANHKGALTEWWYFNGHLVSAGGENYTYGFCLFRVASVLYFAHISLTDEKNNEFSFDRIFYPKTAVKLQQQPARVDYGNEQVLEQVAPDQFRIKGRYKKIQLDLLLHIRKIPMLVNGNGTIEMPEGGRSYYYSLTGLQTNGVIKMGADSIAVRGLSWMDHQWGDFYVRNKGWDWFSLQLEDSTDYNIYSFRNSNGKTLKQYVNILDHTNQLSSYREIKIQRTDFWTNGITGNTYTTEWQLILPGRNDTLLLSANRQNQEIYATGKKDQFPDYWEGSCHVIKKRADGRVVKGIGFAEHFPYQHSLFLPRNGR